MSESVVTPADIDHILDELRARDGLDTEQIDRVYRRLIKQVHPDVVTGNAETFRYTRQAFARFRNRVDNDAQVAKLARDTDMVAPLRDIGLDPDIGPRASLYAMLYRFHALGLASWRIRTRPELRRRNARLIRSIVYWGYRYDPSFVPIFERFLRNHGRFRIAERQSKTYFMLRRVLLRGMDWCIRYHDRGRPATAEIAHDTLGYVLLVALPYEHDDAFLALRDVAAWLRDDLAKGSVYLRLNQ